MSTNEEVITTVKLWGVDRLHLHYYHSEFSIQVYLYSAFYDTIFAKQFTRN